MRVSMVGSGNRVCCLDHYLKLTFIYNIDLNPKTAVWIVRSVFLALGCGVAGIFEIDVNDSDRLASCLAEGKDIILLTNTI